MGELYTCNVDFMSKVACYVMGMYEGGDGGL